MKGFSSTWTMRCKRTFIPLLLIGALASPAAAEVWAVGPGRDLPDPAAAARVVRDGDVVIIDPGVYQGCAIWTASGLTVQARGPVGGMNPTVMTRPVVTGPVCGDRALFFFLGDNITVRGLTFLRARDSGHNGAGILMEGANLTVADTQFLENENGILAGGPPDSVVRVSGSLFRGNGACEGACAHAIYAGRRIARLMVLDSVFQNTQVGHNIKSRALSTVVRGDRIEDGVSGTSSYLIELPEGGDAEIVDNILEKGPHSDNKDAAISIGVPGQDVAAGRLEVRGNRFTNDMKEPVAFVRNTTKAQVRERGNTLMGPVRPLEGRGTVE